MTIAEFAIHSSIYHEICIRKFNLIYRLKITIHLFCTTIAYKKVLKYNKL